MYLFPVAQPLPATYKKNEFSPRFFDNKNFIANSESLEGPTMKTKFIALALVTVATVNLFGDSHPLPMQNVGRRARGRYHRHRWWSGRLRSDEPAVGEWSVFSIRNRGGPKFHK